MLKDIFNWIRYDYKTNQLRFVIEIVAWILSIGANLMFALTVPNVPFVFYLIITVTGCAMYAWASWTRKSFGMLANYLLLVTIDAVGLTRMLIS